MVEGRHADRRDRNARDEQDAMQRQDREASGGDAEAAGTVDQREDVAEGDDKLFGDHDDDEE